MTSLLNAIKESRHAEERPRRRRGRNSKHAPTLQQRVLTHFVFSVLAYFILALAVLLPIRNVISTGFTFDINYNEGWNVYNAARLIKGEFIYDDNYWRINNYPIGSFLIVAGANLFFQNLLLSGRLVALASFVAIGILAAIATLRFGGARTDAVFGAGCAMGFCYLVAPNWIIADDPQSLGEAIMLGALVTYIARTQDRLGLLCTAFLVVLGGFVKHNLVAIPAAVTLDLAIRAPRQLLFWMGCCTGFGGGFLALTQLVAGNDFIDHLLSPRIFAWHGARYHLLKYLRLFKFPLAAVALGAPSVLAGDRMILAVWGTVAIGTATILSGFEGTSYNMFQDAAVFLGIAAGVMMSELRKRDITGRFAGALPLVLPFLIGEPILARVPDIAAQAYHSRAILNADQKRQELFLADAEYIAQGHGPVICESLLLCYTAGRPFILDPFNSRQYMLSGRLDQAELVRRIAAHEFAVIQLHADVCDDPTTPSCHILHYRQKIDRFTDDVLYAIDRYYKVGRRSDFGSFYIPK
ncbi:MAG: hypothetical protein JO229_12420 [Alphaproteobacteria bacterium]|nr:hypothetical protein [Alphaproteobacteria bacterium]